MSNKPDYLGAETIASCGAQLLKQQSWNNPYLMQGNRKLLRERHRHIIEATKETTWPQYKT